MEILNHTPQEINNISSRAGSYSHNVLIKIICETGEKHTEVCPLLLTESSITFQQSDKRQISDQAL